MIIKGCDVASFQGPPTQWQAAAGDIDFAAVKITELQPGATKPYVNPDAAADWAWLGQHGKNRIAYCFAHPKTSAAATAMLFGRETSRLGLVDGDAVALDLEVTDGLPPAEVAAWGRDVLASMRGFFGRPPLLYTYLSFAETGNCAGMGGYPLWISDPSSPAGHPRIPAGGPAGRSTSTPSVAARSRLTATSPTTRHQRRCPPRSARPRQSPRRKQ